MSTKSSQPSLGLGTGAGILRKVAFAVHLAVGSITGDLRVTPLGEKSGAKQPAVINMTLGGCAANGGRVAVANGIATSLLGPQAAPYWTQWAQALAKSEGFAPHIIERSGVVPGITVATPNGRPGAFDLAIQRMEPLTVHELLDATACATKLPRSLFVGPIALDRDSEGLHSCISRIAEHRALMIHPSMCHHPERFAAIGSQYEYVQLNLAEAAILDPTASDIEQLACRVRYLLTDRVDFAITNGSRRGLLWADQQWHVIDPCEVRDILCDLGAGDVFAAAFMISRWYFEALPQSALAYANLAAAAWITSGRIPPYGA